MRFGIVGLGSMGKRRVRDLIALGHAVTGCDIRPDRCREAEAKLGIATCDSFDELARGQLDACVISTPPDQHRDGYERCYARRLPFFSEANILAPRAEWFASKEAESGVRGYPSATWRFYAPLHRLREQIRALGHGQINSFAHHYAAYLPNWHPWEPYTAFYAGQKRTSAAREMVPFEMEALTWMFGPVRAVCAIQMRAGTWQTDMDDSYLLLVEFESGVRGTCSIELHQVAPFRLLRVAAREESFALDFSAHELRHYGLEQKTWRPLSNPDGERNFQFEDVYRAEIACFVAALQGQPYPKTWRDERHLSSILYAAEQSALRRAWMGVAEAEALYDGLNW